MLRLVTTGIVLAGLVWGMVAGVQWLTPRIENDLKDRVTGAMSQHGLMFADAVVKGREVTVTGNAPDKDAHDAALSTAAKVFGVAKVNDGMSVAGKTPADVAAHLASLAANTTPEEVHVPMPPAMPEEPITKPDNTHKVMAISPYTLTIEKDGERVTLRGVVDSEASKMVILKLATDRYGTASVTDNIALANGAPQGWRSAVGAVLINMSNLDKATATLSNTEVMISGEVVDKSYGARAEKAISKALPTNYKVAFAMDEVIPDVAPAEGTHTMLAKVQDLLGTVARPVTQAMAGDCAADRLKIHKVMFAFDRADITPVYGPTLDKVAAIANACNGLVVEGHTDTTGSDLYNKWLSEQRAEAGVRGLIRHGADKRNLSAVGFGNTRPVASNKTRSGRAANRRIEFTTVGNHGSAPARTSEQPGQSSSTVTGA